MYGCFGVGVGVLVWVWVCVVYMFCSVKILYAIYHMIPEVIDALQL